MFVFNLLNKIVNKTTKNYTSTKEWQRKLADWKRNKFFWRDNLFD